MNKAEVMVSMFSAFSECLIVLYYSNSVAEYKENRFKSNMLIIVSYFIYSLICAFGVTTLNVSLFIVMNFFIFRLGFKDGIGRCFLNVFILTVFMMFSEIVASYIAKSEITQDYHYKITVAEAILFFFVSKFVYAIFVIELVHFSTVRKKYYKTKELIMLMILPIATCMYLGVFNRIRSSVNVQSELVLLIISLLLMAANFVVYYIYDRMVSKSMQLKYLQEVKHKEAIDYNSYRILKDKYTEMRIMAHDFTKYCNNIEAMLSSSQEEAAEQLQKIKNKNKELLLAEYTKSKLLNILLSQKLQDCNRNNIDLRIYAQNIDLSFIDELDMVSIFSNLIDNAIESCKRSSKKQISLSISLMNEFLMVISIENSCDAAPRIINGRLRTLKKNKDEHGVGMTSIKKAAEKYNGILKWNYDEHEKMFSSNIVISIPG